jgi:hypothetical protein
MKPTADDLAIEAVVRGELDRGVAALATAGFAEARVQAYRHPRTASILFDVGGRFEACPDRDVHATVEVDPARLGWRLEATLWMHPDSEDHDREVASLGGARVEHAADAARWGRTLATAAWTAVADVLRASCRPGEDA